MSRIYALTLAAMIAGASPVAAQGFNMSKGNNQQIQVYADNGIEWMSEATRVIARGNAKAIRGAMEVTADTLIAYYREGASGSEIWRLDAEGNVVITSPTQKATGTKATYDLDKAVLIMRGQPARLTTEKEVVVANDTLEYWETERMAVARGDAVATQKDRTLKADVLTSHFKEAAKKNMEMSHSDAYGHVVLTTAIEQVTGDRGDYNAETGIATVSGSVKIIRDGNQLEGGYAHVNLNTGISKLFGAAPGGKGGDGRVRGLLKPEKKDEDKRHAVFNGAGPAAEGDSAPQGQNQNGR